MWQCVSGEEKIMDPCVSDKLLTICHIRVVKLVCDPRITQKIRNRVKSGGNGGKYLKREKKREKYIKKSNVALSNATSINNFTNY